ncbi:uncharacterized protein LOC123300651 [Chrysoperla carnea]|uniref:uncharacterized protein LOC123300651 n=1 Tax=Chrysoperla carnea TaxID=189513 RepID=UPI001D096620|nr:uncharacterized protein LOC123300651 [Chrysoperla carnea]
MDKEMLIELVRKCPELYDVANSNYSDNKHKDIIWKHIAKKLDSTPMTCKKNWVNLRDSFRRNIRNKRHNKNSNGSEKLRAWKYEEQMEFLIPHFQDTKTSSLPKITDNVSSDDVYESYENDLENEALFTNPLKIEGSDDENEDTKRRKYEINIEEMGNVLCSQDIENSIIYKRSKLDPINIQQDPLDLFFISIAATVKNFSLYHQNIAKSKIFQIVSEIEMQQILNGNQTQETVATNNTTHTLLTTNETAATSNIQTL